MSIFNRIKIKNFRGIKGLELNNFKQFNVLVGKNDTGKTSVLEALYISINPGNPNLPLTVNLHRGIDTLENIQFWKSLYRDYNIDNSIEFDSVLFNKHKLKMVLTPKVTPATIINEEMTLNLPDQTTSTEQLIKGLEIHFTYDGDNNVNAHNYNTEITFSLNNPQSPLAIKNPEGWKQILNGYYLSVQNTYDPSLAKRVGELITLKQEKELVGVLQEIDPRIKDINLDGASRVLVDVEGLPQRILINSLGEGLYRIANIITLIYRSQNGIVLIDEAEAGLDRNSQRKLWKAIFKAATKYNVQIFVTTHSIELIDIFYEIATEEKHENNISLIRLERDNEGVIKPVYFDYQQIQFSRNQGWEIR